MRSESLRQRLLRGNRFVAWLWLAAMCADTIRRAARGDTIGTATLHALALFVQCYFFVHAGIALWCYRFPRPCTTRFHFTLYSGYSVLAIALAQSLFPVSMRYALQLLSWILIVTHVTVVAWSVGCRYQFSWLQKILLSTFVCASLGIIATCSIRSLR